MKIVIDKRKGYIVLGLCVVMVLAATAMPHTKNSETPQETASTTVPPAPSTTVLEEGDAASDLRVELYHFHGTNQCWSCITLGELAEKTVDTHFKKELDSGRMVFGHVNGELPENMELVQKYGARGSSLFIGTYVNGEFHREENVKVWYKLNNEEDYMVYLKGILDKRLQGDLT